MRDAERQVNKMCFGLFICLLWLGVRAGNGEGGGQDRGREGEKIRKEERRR